jgi:hypothetical protein
MLFLASLLSAWLQYGADGQPHARAVASTSCPTLTVDGRTLPMRTRAGANTRFTDIVCDTPIPATAKHVRVGERNIPAPVEKLNTIVVLGDTGCRIKGLETQSCNDPEGWPFPTIARSIAKVHPDLIVHVGDYLYRESACPPFNHGCAGSPSGDITQAWDADWFVPAAPLFASAPLILARGNHEVCDRAGMGWFHYLNPTPSSTCEEMAPPYAVQLNGLRLVLFDTAAGGDQSTNQGLIERERIYFSQAHALISGPTWFITHRPPYFNVNERTAMGANLTGFSAVLAGHIHLFSAWNLAGLPPLVINGEGGDNLDADIVPVLPWALGNLHTVGASFTEPHFGFGVYTRTANGWRISLRTTDGTESAHCVLEKNRVQCSSAATTPR